MKAIGLKEGTVKLRRYTPEWARLYEAEQGRLQQVLPKRGVAIAHIGSTAVPGLDAKPIIDIAIRVPSFRPHIAKLEALGYEYKGEYGLPGRHFFVRGNPVSYHVHLVKKGSRHWTVWLLFRDYLMSHPAEARRYNRFKRRLARRFAGDRPAYTRAKAPFVESLLAKAESSCARG
jgi:GrpB-like predicted nucleotidyltransferase (UPF0157 family)